MLNPSCQPQYVTRGTSSHQACFSVIDSFGPHLGPVPPCSSVQLAIPSHLLISLSARGLSILLVGVTSSASSAPPQPTLSTVRTPVHPTVRVGILSPTTRRGGRPKCATICGRTPSQVILHIYRSPRRMKFLTPPSHFPLVTHQPTPIPVSLTLSSVH